MRKRNSILFILFSLLFCNIAFSISDSVVVFNEVMYHPEENEVSLEWVELYNQMSVNVDLSGWSIRGGIEYDFPQGTVIAADDYIVIAISPLALETDTGYANAYGPFEGRLSNSGEELRLRDNNKRIMDLIDYRDDGQWPVAPDGSGVSLAKYAPLSTGETPSNWRASYELGGTPGQVNFPGAAPYLQEYDIFLASNSLSTIFIPSNSSVGTTWREPGYDDSGWTSGVTPISYDVLDSSIFNFALNKPVVNGSSAWSNNPFDVGTYSALNVTDGIISEFASGSYWLGSNNSLNEYFILDLEESIYINKIILRNTHNSTHNDRGTDDFQIWASNAIDASKQLVSPQLILSGSLSNVNGVNPIPADLFTEANGLTLRSARYLKFVALTANNSGNHVGLNEIEVYGGTDIEGQMYQANSTGYFRLPFTFDDQQEYDQLTLSMRYNDGFVAFLNGTKILERNAPASLSWNSAATTERPDSQYEANDISEHFDLLMAGQNVLAIQGLNISASDDNFLIAPKLEARRKPPTEDKTVLVINEIPSAGTTPFWIEIYNYGHEPVSLDGYVLKSSNGSSDILTGSIAPDEYQKIDFSGSTLLGDKLFLYSQDAASVVDAVVVKDRLRGHLPGEPETKLQYPLAATPNAVNSFDLHDEIVINEIMYHHRPEYEIADSAPSYTTDILVAFDDSWKYDQSGDDLGISWKDVSYDDLSWPSGPGVLGLDSATFPESIQTPLSVSSKITYYFRTTFDYTSDIQNVALKLETLIDDGAIFYLNGAEIYRTSNMPAGPVGYQTLSGGVGNAVLAGPFTVPHDNLITGTNVLAVEVHQASTVSSDIVFGMELSIYGSDNPAVLPYVEIEEEWIELFNNSNQPVDLSGWKLDDAVEYEFPPGTTMAAGQYLVIAEDKVQLQAKYPALSIVGQYTGGLSNNNERIVLLDANENTADQVHYYGDGKWPKAADGGGSSLELRNPFADNSKGQAWAGSDEQSRSPWRHYSYTATAYPLLYSPVIYFHELVLGLLDSGQVLLDNISVVENPDTNPIEFMQNVNFEGDTLGQWPNKWRIQGTHHRSVVAVDPDNPTNKVLHLIADGPPNYLSNHAETTFANSQTVVDGNAYQISFDAKWISGCPLLRTELYYCDVARKNVIEMPTISGTPGSQNSTYQANLGPTYSNLRHYPLIPSSIDSVEVSVEASDPDGVQSMLLWYSVNGSGSWNSLTMADMGNGQYAAQLPAASHGSIVQFYIASRDQLNEQSYYPTDGPDSGAFYKVDDEFAVDPLRRDFRFIMDPGDSEFMFLDTNILSNDRIGATVIYNNQDVFYDAGIRLKGSVASRQAFVYNRIAYNVRFQPDHLLRGVHDTVTLRAESMTELVPKHLVNQSGGVPGMYDDVVNLTTSTGSDGSGIVLMSMARFGDIFLESQYDNGKDGTIFKMEGIRQMSDTTGGPEDLKVYRSGVGWVHEFDLANMGDNPETYRWMIKINRNRAKDDYSRIIEMCKMFSLNGSALQQAAAEVLDVDEWMRKYALVSLCGVYDTYTKAFSHNVNFYVRPSDNKVLAMPWDWDWSFSVYVPTNDPLWGNRNLSKVIALPVYNRLFMGHLHDMINTKYNRDYMDNWIDHYSLISGLNFTDIKTYIYARSNYVTSQLPAAINFRITTNYGADISVDDDGVVIQGKGWINVRNIFLNDNQEPLDVEWLDDETWQFSVPLEFGANVLNLKAHDFQGNIIATDTITISSTVDERPLRNYLRVTELMYDPVGGSDYEFIELCNTDNNAHDISNVTLVEVDGEGITFAFAGSDVTSLGPNECVLVVKNKDKFSSRYDTAALKIAGEFAGKLGNGGERVTVEGNWNSDILSFKYADSRSWPLAADGAGHSLVPLDSANASQPDGSLNYGGNWRASTYIHGSPGVADPAQTVTVGLNEFMAHTDYDNSQYPDYDSNDWIELYNPSTSSIDLTAGHWYLSDDKDLLNKWTIPATTVPSHGMVSFDEVTGFHNPISQGFGLNKAGEQIYLSYLPGTNEDRVVDCVRFKSQENGISLSRYPDGSQGWYRTSPSRNSANLQPLGNVIINEFMYHPQLDKQEYIELYNSGSAPVELWDNSLGLGWRLDGGISFDFASSTEIPAGGYLLILGVDPTQTNLQAFEAAYDNVPSAIVGPYDGKLSDITERIALEKPQASDDPLLPDDFSWIIYDEVIYFNLSPWRSEANGTGKALIRKTPQSCGSAPTAWYPAIPTPGAAQSDFTADGVIDLLDIAEFSNFWLSQSGDEHWDARYELYPVPDGIVNLLDLTILCKQWLK